METQIVQIIKSLLDEVLGPARALGLQVRVLLGGPATEIEAAFKTFSREPVDGLLTLSDPVYLVQRDQIAQLEVQYRVPTVYALRDHVLAGSLASYGANVEDAYYQAGIYSSRILKGEKPADLPVLEPTKFHLAINLKTAGVIGLEVSPMLLSRADKLIE